MHCLSCGPAVAFAVDFKGLTMKTLLSNINHAIRNKETVTIGGGDFEAHELYNIIQLYEAASKAEIALSFTYGGEPLPSLEKEALEALRLVLNKAEVTA